MGKNGRSFGERIGSLFHRKPYDGEEGEPGAGRNAKDNRSGLRSFSFSYDGTIGGNNYSYDLKEKDGVWTLSYESMEHNDYGKLTAETESAVADKLNDLYLSLRIAEWDGFQRYNSMVCDGDGFSVRFGFQDGGSVSAHGSNAYPDRYREFRQGMDALLDPIRDQMLEDARQAVIRKGCKGNVTSVLAVFKQQGTSGSDSYHLLLTKHGVRTKNFDLRVQADSESFFPAGETVLCLSVPDDRLPFRELTELVRKHDLIRWYDYEATDPDYGNREWFQICFGLDDGTSIRAMGTKHPDGYDEFREDFLRAIAKAAETLSSPGDEEKD